MSKPVFGIGGPMTDSNFNIIRMSKAQAQREADKQARKTVKHGLSRHARGFVFDAGSHYRISVCVSTPERAA
ncbi:hypothetical protein [Klebsiella pneumoniae]|uniref:hypothetical protein n=1 Tax=Klebsiella pneumoniae TaxID=573 RepID=UPI00115E54A9|nr:hypothetical protein [Klebsiella pneumoniae]EKU5585722.1 hypothetical protein [Klebsiella pneumoniae]EKV3385255.1 hypothetical protein [Klebsiella pneumoniae]MBO3720642.1 hypothetical protein [Klebsiella pneumoniae]MDY7671096.1 hypothetical protein [Klebsiella pneumoniae]MDY7767008.1 hypothetical protein [Klebsiella pneumoniae]